MIPLITAACILSFSTPGKVYFPQCPWVTPVRCVFTISPNPGREQMPTSCYDRFGNLIWYGMSYKVNEPI